MIQTWLAQLQLDELAGVARPLPFARHEHLTKFGDVAVYHAPISSLHVLARDGIA